MLNYSVNYIESEYHVVELDTQQSIKVFPNICTANKLCNALNRGIGFDGWTPSFILTPAVKKIKKYKELV
jgi:hypothetical protein